MNEGKATRYHRLRRRTRLLAAVGGVAVLVSLLASGASAGIRDVMTQGVAVLGLPPAWRHASVAAAHTACVWALLEGLLLPLRFFHGFVLERRYALSSVGAARWVCTHVKTVALSGGIVVAAAVVVSRSLAVWPAGWWVVSGAAFVAATILLTNLAPVCIIPRLYSVRPLTRTRLTERLAALAERVGVPAPRVEEWVIGGTTRRAQATLVGLGPTRRILLSDTLLADYSDDEIEVVLAHELGHQVHRDVWRLIAFELSVTLTALLVGGPSGRVVRSGRRGRRGRTTAHRPGGRGGGGRGFAAPARVVATSRTARRPLRDSADPQPGGVHLRPAAVGRAESRGRAPVTTSRTAVSHAPTALPAAGGRASRGRPGHLRPRAVGLVGLAAARWRVTRSDGGVGCR